MRRARQPLLVLASAAWAGAVIAWLGYGTDAAPAAGPVLLALLAAAALLSAALPAPWRGTALIVAIGAAAGAASLTIHLANSRPEVLRTWSDEGERVVLQARVGSASVQQTADLGARPSVRIVAVASQVRRGRQLVTCRSPFLLLGQPLALPAPPRGTVLVVSGVMLPDAPLREPGLALRVERVLTARPPSGWAAAVAAARAAMWHAMSGIDPDAASLVAGLAIGDDSRQSAALGDAMRVSGLSHLLAVSGGNVAILAGLVVGATALAGARMPVRVGLGVLAVVGYAAFVGPEPSVLRAALMGAVALVGVLRGARGGGFPLLGAAVFVLLLVRPGMALSWAFALSVAATAGILALAPGLDQWLADRLPDPPRRLSRSIAAALAVTLAAQAATAPLLAAMTGTVSLVGIPANMVAEPLVAPITILGLAIVALAAPCPWLASWLAVVVEPFGRLLATIARWGSTAPIGTLHVPDGGAGAVVVAGAMLVVLAVARWWSTAWAAAAAISALLAAAMLGGAPAPPNDWVAAACDVGQGDAFLVRTGPGAALLIDTGPRSTDLWGCLDRMRVRRIPLLVLTRFDTDHVAAAPMVLQRFRPRAVVLSPVDLPQANAAAVLDAAGSAGVPVVRAQPGQRFAVGAAAVQVLWPRRLVHGSSSNNAVVATAVRAAGIDLLFTGDLEPAGQAGLMASVPAGLFEVTTIPHHGSADQDRRFLSWTGADIAWVCAGQGNRFGYPRPEALQLAARAAGQIGRTDQQGTLVITVAGGAPHLVGLGPQHPPAAVPQRREGVP